MMSDLTGRSATSLPLLSYLPYWLPGQDLNLEWEDQNLLCYQLHHRVVPAFGGNV